MKKIMVIGGCGAGKSTLSRQLQAILGIELIHLDQEYWKANWVETEAEIWESKIKKIVKKDSWIIDGNYGGSLHIRLKEADTIVFLDRSRWTCLYRVIKRISLNHGRVRDDMPKGCEERFNWEFLKYTYSFYDNKRPNILKKLEEYAEGKEIVRLTSDREVNAFLEGLREQFQK